MDSTAQPLPFHGSMTSVAIGFARGFEAVITCSVIELAGLARPARRNPAAAQTHVFILAVVVPVDLLALEHSARTLEEVTGPV